MSYKAILFGILLLLTMHQVASAQPATFASSGSGTQFGGSLSSAFAKFKDKPFTSLSDTMLDAAVTLTIATDPQFNDVIATLQMMDYFDTGPSTGAFSFVQNDGSNFGVFNGTFKTQGGLLTSFTGTLVEIFADGGFVIMTLKSGKQVVP